MAVLSSRAQERRSREIRAQSARERAVKQLWNSGRQDWISSRIGDQESTISDPGQV